MKSLCSQHIKIPSSKIDFNGKVGVIQALEIFQDNMCEYYKRLNCDGIYMIPKCHAFWALIKTKIKFYKDVNWLDKCNIKTDVCKLSNVRMNLSSALYDENRNLAISCLQEIKKSALDILFTKKKPCPRWQTFFLYMRHSQPPHSCAKRS